MAQANVFTSVANAFWYTDRVSVSTGNTSVTYNVYVPALVYKAANGNPVTAVNATGNIYSNAVSIPANSTQEVFVGSGNYLTITGTSFTALEIGTASSGNYGVVGVGS